MLIYRRLGTRYILQKRVFGGMHTETSNTGQLAFRVRPGSSWSAVGQLIEIHGFYDFEEDTKDRTGQDGEQAVNCTMWCWREYTGDVGMGVLVLVDFLLCTV